jgi:hypothetical protein
MELGNLIFGHSQGEYEVSRKYESLFETLAEALGFTNYFGDFECELFETHAYWWGDCTCGVDDLTFDNDEIEPPHSSTCMYNRPNFIYKPTGYELRWYKYPLRDSYGSEYLTEKEFTKMMLDCIKWALNND